MVSICHPPDWQFLPVVNWPRSSGSYRSALLFQKNDRWSAATGEMQQKREKLKKQNLEIFIGGKSI
jgi:hypothetical protein